MSTARKKLYLLFLAVFGAGYGWIAYQWIIDQRPEGFTVCLFKNATHLPCPSCGSTRAVLSILDFDFYSALFYNPLGFLIVPALLLIPSWISRDLIIGKDSFWRFYLKTEQLLKKPPIAIPLVLLTLALWAWNIYKEI